MPDMTRPAQINGRKYWFRRLLPLGILVAAIGAFFASGLHQRLSFDEIAINYASLTGMVAEHPLVSALTVIAIYAAATALSFPIAWLLTVTTGLIFGWAIGALLVTIGATLGASVLYFIARFALADFFKARAGPILNKMADGFRKDATSYMLFLRMAPIFPFTLINVVPAILGVPFFTFAWTTFVGIIPAVIAYSFAGEGLRSIVMERAEACAQNVAPCGEALSPGDLVTPQIIIAFALLGIVALIPIVLRRIRNRRLGNST